MKWPRDPGELGVAEWKRLVEEQGGRVPPRVRESLASDPRSSIRDLVPALERRREALRREGRRLQGLLVFENELWASGLRRVAGVDEAGMGPLAGPVVAAAVVLSPGQRFEGLDDSKRLQPRQRERLAGLIKAEALGFAIGWASVADIAEADIFQAGLLAMRRAVEALEPSPEHLLVDARRVPGVAMPQDAHVKGDARSLSIAAASVIAKTERDAHMAELDASYPGYAFARHQGYGTPEHLEALRRLGPCPAHRRSWKAVGEYGGAWSPAYYELRDGLAAVGDSRAFERWRQRAGRAACDLTPDELQRLEGLAARREAGLSRPLSAASPTLPFD